MEAAGRGGVVAEEERRAPGAGVAALVGAVAVFVGSLLLRSALSGDTNYEGLLNAYDQSSKVWISGVATLLGYFLLTWPLLLLFRAAQARSERVRNQFVGLVVMGPMLLGLAGIGIAAGTQDAGDSYVAGDAEPTLTKDEAREECADDRRDMGAEDFADEYAAKGRTAQQACVAQKLEEDRASNAIRDSSVVTLSRFLGLAGGLSLVAALLYTGLWSMRTGLLTRFWGSLGMAVGIAALIGLSPLMLVWFLYLGLLLLGWVPGGKPPAWAAGEAVPWPTPGEKAAAELEPAEEAAAEENPGEGAPEPGEGGDGPPRKRKRRD